MIGGYMKDRDVLLQLLELQDLPTLPVIVDKILEMTADDQSSASDLTALLERDHAISARLLRLANSAFYGLTHHVDSVRRGVVVLGFNETRYLALATSVFDALMKRDQSAFEPEDFWMHSFGAAKAAQMLSVDYCREGGREEWFAAGLLHDIGKYVLAITLKDEYKQLVDGAKAAGRALIDVEIEQLGITHARVGQWLVDKWRLPPVIGIVSAKLHQIKVYKGANREVIAGVAVANMLSVKARFGYAGDDPDSPVDAALLSILDVTRDEFDAIANALSLLRDETRQFLKIL